jgi:hypothetical protein
MSAFDQFAPSALARAGVPFEAGDLDVLRIVAQVFDPAMCALDEADLADLPLEGDLDPSRPPNSPTVTRAPS